jgi:hypothetical protein
MTYRSAFHVLAVLGLGIGVACSSSSTPAMLSFDGGHTTGGTDGSSEAESYTNVDSGNGDGGIFDAGDDDAYFSVAYQCSVPATPPSGGSCVTVVAANDAGTGIQCNPVTNAGCSAGEACDVSRDSNQSLIGFICYPGPNPEGICAICPNGSNDAGECAAGGTCLLSDPAIAQCARYCCTDADCGEGTCQPSPQGATLFGPVAPSLGVCVNLSGDGGSPPGDSGVGGSVIDGGAHDSGAPIDAGHG